MIESISMNISTHLVKKSVITMAMRDRIAYGLSLILAAGVITTAIMIIGAATGMMLQCLIYSLLFWTTRNVVGLIHCNAYYKCFSLSVGLYLLMTFTYIYTSSAVVPFLWLGMAAGLLVYKGFEIHNITDAKTKHNLAERFKKLCGIATAGGVVAAFLSMLAARAISFPISYGVFVVSLLFVPETHSTKKEKKS